MDTDDFSELSQNLINRAAEVSDTLKAELAAISTKCGTEDEWLQGVFFFLQEILTDPQAYVDFWDLEDAEGLTAKNIGELADILSGQVETMLTGYQAEPD
jgi:hypothetical protein